MNNVAYLCIYRRQRAERQAALLKLTRPSLRERIAYYFRRIFT